MSTIQSKGIGRRLHRKLVLKSKWMYNIYYFFYFFGVGSFLPLYTKYLLESGFTRGQTGTILSVLPLVLIFSQPIWGIINDKTGASTKIIISSLIMLGITELIIFSTDIHSVSLMVLLTVIFGIFNFAISPIQDGLSVLFTKKYNYKFGSIRIWGSIGWMVATAVSATAVKHYGFESIMYLSGVSYLIAVILFLKVKKVRQKKVVGNATVDKFGHIVDVITNKSFLKFMLFAAFTVGIMNSIPSFYQMRLDDLEAPTSFMGYMNTVMVSMEIVTMFLLISLRNVFKDIQLLVIAILTQIPVLIILILVDDINILIVVAILRGIYQGIVIPVIINYVASILKSEQVSAGIMINSALALGAMNWLATISGGYISEYSFPLLFTILLVIVLSALTITLLFQLKSKPIEQDH